MTTIRRADAADADALIRMARRFLSADGPYGTRFALDETRIGALVQQMTSGASTCTLVALDAADQAVGMFALFIFTHPITGERLAAELCWWMEPEARGGRTAWRMLRAAEQWARDEHATALEMIAPDERVASFYDRLAYQRTDVHYRKTL